MLHFASFIRNLVPDGKLKLTTEVGFHSNLVTDFQKNHERYSTSAFGRQRMEAETIPENAETPTHTARRLYY